MPRGTSVACGSWAVDEEEPLWGLGLEQGFCLLGLHPVTWGLAAGDREQVTPWAEGDTSLTGRGSSPNSCSDQLGLGCSPISP